MIARRLLSFCTSMCSLLVACTGQTDRPVYVTAQPDPRSVTVTGEAEIKVVPDEATVIMGIENFDPVLATVRAKNDEGIRKLMAAATAAGIEPKHLQTEQMEIEPRYDERNHRRELEGYMARRTVTLTIKELAKFESTLASVLDAGANLLMGVQFRTTELRKHRDAARSMALRAAREKAEAMVAELGQKIARPHSIEEEPVFGGGFWSWGGGRFSGGMTQNVMQSSAGASSLEGTIAPGQIPVTARVRVRFELQ